MDHEDGRPQSGPASRSAEVGGAAAERKLPLTRYWCTDCKSCEQTSPKSSRVGIAKEGTGKNGLAFLAKVTPRYRGSIRNCALCGHTDKEHWVGLYASGLAVAPSSGRFVFEPGDAMVFRFVKCLEAPSDSGLDLGLEYELAFLDDGIDFIRHGSVVSVEHVPFDALAFVEVGGPGKAVSDLGVGGIGFTPSSFAKASIAATLVNVASTNIQVETHIRIGRKDSLGGSSWMFSTTAFEPSVVRRALEPIDRRARNGDLPLIKQTGAPSPSKIDDLSRLIAMREQGHLTDEEFKRLKAEILDI